MRATGNSGGLTVRVIAGTERIIVAMDLSEELRRRCMGFSICRSEAGKADRWLPNLLTFPGVAGDGTTATAPLQKFRWGDYTADPGTEYTYRVVARTGTPADIAREGARPVATRLAEVAVTVRTEANDAAHRIFFNRGAAASKAYVDRFGDVDPDKAKKDKNGHTAFQWLSRGLEEALIAFLGQAGRGDQLHAAIYEFQKPELLAALAAADRRGVKVDVVIHARDDADGKGKTREKNRAAIAAAGFSPQVTITERDARPDNAIMHNKFVVRLQGGKPVAVWTGSTNWTEGAIYGQLNVGHAIDDEGVAAQYEAYFQVLRKNQLADPTKTVVGQITPVPLARKPAPGTTPIFSPQASEAMLTLYGAICADAGLLMVSAPFELHDKIRDGLINRPAGTLHFLLVDKPRSLGGNDQEINVVQHDVANSIAVATTLGQALHDYQGRVLETKESFHHAGVHIHSKILLADPFGDDPVLVTGSANFSSNSTLKNDSNSLVVRGDTTVADIYATEFMRMFEHYHFRAKDTQAKLAGKSLDLAKDAGWTDKYYVAGSHEARDRTMFAG